MPAKLELAVVAVFVASASQLTACAPLGVEDNNGFFSYTTSEKVELVLLQRLDAGSVRPRDDRRGTFNGSEPGRVSAVAARGDDLWLIDQSTMRLLHVDLLLLESHAIATIRHPGSQGLFATENLDIYVVDRSTNSIKQFDRMGRSVREFSDRNLLTAPVDIAVLNFGSSIVVADATGLWVGYPDMLRKPSRVDIGKDNIFAVTDLWIDGDRLYVAAGNQGIIIYAVTPACPGA